MEGTITKDISSSYGVALEKSEEIKLILGSEDHLDYVSKLAPLHNELISSLQNFSDSFAKDFPCDTDTKEIMVDKIKKLFNLVEFTRMTYESNKLTLKSFPNFISQLLIESNQLLEFITDLQRDNSAWEDEDLLF